MIMSMSVTLLVIAIIFLLPLFLAIVFGMTKMRNFERCLWIVVGLVILLLVVLLLWGHQSIDTDLFFMGERITFSISSTSIGLFLGILLVLIAMILYDLTSRQGQLNKYQSILISTSLSFAFVAFISGQFMIRFIALDIAGLFVALTVLNSLSNPKFYKSFSIIFLILRLGDLSLLSSILIINHFAGTLNISEMITAAAQMPLSSQFWAYSGFILAVWIKLGIWPFGVWIHHARRLTNNASFWISGFMMPSLGYYLLYRIVPMIEASEIFRYLSLSLGISLFFLILLIEYFGLMNDDRFKVMSSISGSLLLIVFPFSDSHHLIYYFLGLVIYRFLIWLSDGAHEKGLKSIARCLPLALNGIFLWLNYQHFSGWFTIGWVLLTLIWVIGDWIIEQRQLARKVSSVPIKNTQSLESSGDDLISSFARWLNKTLEQDILSKAFSGTFLVQTAQWVNQKLEIGIFTNGIYRLGEFFGRMTSWVRKVVEDQLEKGWTWIGQELTTISESALSKAEVDAAYKTDAFVNDALKSLEIHEEKVLKKKLRWDLMWIPILMIILLIYLMVV
jgi:hypothetical protein